MDVSAGQSGRIGAKTPLGWPAGCIAGHETEVSCWKTLFCWSDDAAASS